MLGQKICDFLSKGHPDLFSRWGLNVTVHSDARKQCQFSKGTFLWIRLATRGQPYTSGGYLISLVKRFACSCFVSVLPQLEMLDFSLLGNEKRCRNYCISGLDLAAW